MLEEQSPPRCQFDSNNLILQFESTIPADVKEISPVAEGVMAIVKQMGCAAGREFEVETALREALANAIVHGAKKDPKKKIQFCVSCDESRGMLIVVRDSGVGYDPASIPTPVLGQELFSTHGRGIYLINQMVDEVRFEKGGTEIHMVVR
ncbi:MAG: ATP-binding protein [Acidobacteria bacterium]|nr:ATP-binding protein [Acidobacteriota bacterium]